MGLIEQLREDAEYHVTVANDCDCNPEDTINWRHAEVAKAAADEIESLRQQLAAALAACEAKDEAIKDYAQFRPTDLSKSALAIKPDASALRQHDNARIEKIKAPGPSAYLCTHIQSGEMVVTADDSQDIFDRHERALWFIEPLYRLPKGE